MTATFEDLRHEYAQVVIGPQLLELLQRVVLATAPIYPPAEYSETGRWDDEARQDLLHSWAEVRLLRRGDLGAMLGAAPSLPALRAMLTTSLGQFVINGRKRTAAANLFKRAEATLASDEQFTPVGPTAKRAAQPWTLTELDYKEPSTLGVRELVAISFELSDDDLEVARYGPFSLKSSPILRADGLRRFLVHLLGRAEGTLTPADIGEVMRRRFNLIEVGIQEMETALASDEEPTPTVVERDELARSIVARMGYERIEALREFHSNDGQFSAVATALAVSQAHAANLVKETMQMIADYSESADEALAVYERVVESLF